MTQELENSANRPLFAYCDDVSLRVKLADGRCIATPLWWYPFLDELRHDQRNAIELTNEGIWWTAADEGISVKSMLQGRKAPGAIPPKDANLVHEAE